MQPSEVFALIVRGYTKTPIQIGDTFSGWTVIGSAALRGAAKQWMCRCKCGREKIVLAATLRNGQSTQCRFCARASRGRRDPVISSTLACWRAMVYRCTAAKPGSHNDKYYRSKGIQVCDRWLTFANFVEDMGPRPSPKHSIDRHPNPSGNYEPGNCRWATQKEQISNRAISAR